MTSPPPPPPQKNFSKPKLKCRKHHLAAFTLIELSIALVIIGLLVAGILLGREMIQNAAVKSEISQIQQFSSAANTFQAKFGALPGDITPVLATQFGLMSRNGRGGMGDGNGLIEGFDSSNPCDTCVFGGESALFWIDLSTIQLIPGSFANNLYPYGSSLAVTAVPQYLPTSKLGVGNYRYVYGYSGNSTPSTLTHIIQGRNYFGIQTILSPINVYAQMSQGSAPAGITTVQASQIDLKLDDGNAMTGKIMAGGLTGNGGSFYSLPSSNNTPASGTSCFDSNSGAYYTANTSPNCALLIETGF